MIRVPWWAVIIVQYAGGFASGWLAPDAPLALMGALAWCLFTLFFFRS